MNCSSFVLDSLSESNYSCIQEVLVNEVVEVEAFSNKTVIHLAGGTLAIKPVILRPVGVLLSFEGMQQEGDLERYGRTGRESGWGGQGEGKEGRRSKEDCQKRKKEGEKVICIIIIGY